MDTKTDIAAHQNKPLPLWTWFAGFLVFYPAAIISKQLCLEAGLPLCFLPAGLAMVLTLWWGLRVLPALLIAIFASSASWEFEECYLCALWTYPILLEIICFSFLYRLSCKNKYWLKDISYLLKFMFVCVGFPFLVFGTLAVSQLIMLGQFPKEMWAMMPKFIISDYLVNITLITFLSAFVTPWMVKRGLSRTAAPHPELKLEWHGFKIFELILMAIAVLGMFFLMRRYYIGILFWAISIYSVLRLGLKFTILLNSALILLAAVVQPMLEPNLYFASHFAIFELSMVQMIIASMIIAIVISNNKEAAFKISEAKAQMRSILDVSNIGLVVIDKNEVVIECNEAAARAIGKTSAEVIGTVPDESVVEQFDDKGNLLNREELPHFYTLRTGNPVKNILLEIRKKDNPEYPRWKLCNTQPIFADSESPQAVAFAFCDITEIREHQAQQIEFEKQAQQLRKLQSLSDLAGGIAHDFNNLLMTIHGNTELAMDAAEEDSSQRDYLSQILLASQKAAKLTNQMLAYAGKGCREMLASDINSLVRKAIEQTRQSLPEQITLEFSRQEDIPAIHIDNIRITQVICDLIFNAIEAIGDIPGTITIETSLKYCPCGQLMNLLTNEPLAAGDYAVISVCDNGCGMDGDTLSRIFEPFYSTKFMGRGLSLPAAEGIVRSNNGTIQATSTPGGGTRFNVFLPVYPIEAHEPARDSRTQISHSKNVIPKKTVLVVDDDPQVLNIAEKMLSKLNYNVVTANHGLEAIEILKGRSTKIDAVIIDLLMPVMSGWEAVRNIRKIDTTVPVILASGYSDKEIISHYNDKFINGMLKKPFSFEELQHAIRACLAENQKKSASV